MQLLETVILYGLVCIMISIVIVGYMVYNLSRQISSIEKQKPLQKANTKRTHTSITPAKYDNVINSRNDNSLYDVYKNKKTGLYEPRVPKKGIIPKKKEE